jgi:L,D-transpeptidase ErfK/SrfK
MINRVRGRGTCIPLLYSLVLCFFCTRCLLFESYAEEFKLPPSAGDNVIGRLYTVTVQNGETLLDIARAHDIGYDQIIAANPLQDRWLPTPGSLVLIPSLYVLPNTQRRGIVLNLAELRLYFYPPKGETVHTFPVSIGDVDWRTPIGITSITAKQRDPTWTPPQSIIAEHELEGEHLPRSIAPGDPLNPLGRFALRLGIARYLIHGTDESRSFGIGMRVSHGCIRLYPEDIEQLFNLVSVGTSVRIIHEPIKVGTRGGLVFLEVHKQDKDPYDRPWPFESPSLDDVYRIIAQFAASNISIDPDAIAAIYDRGSGIPGEI